MVEDVRLFILWMPRQFGLNTTCANTRCGHVRLPVNSNRGNWNVAMFLSDLSEDSWPPISSHRKLFTIGEAEIERDYYL